MALPCMVPKEWIAPPDFESQEGELYYEEEEGLGGDERARMLEREESRASSQRHSVDQAARDDLLDRWDSEEERRQGGNGKGKAPMRDTSGRVVPPSERAPLI